MIDGCQSQEEEEMFTSDETSRDISVKLKETAPELSCHTCGEEIDSDEFVNDEKLYCSEECMERETPSSVPVESTRRRVSTYISLLINKLPSCMYAWYIPS